MRRLIFVFIAACTGMALCCGCSKKEGDEPTKYVSQAGLEKLSRNQGQVPKKESPAFFGFADSGAKAPAAQDLDSAIRPVLKKVFGDAKIIAESKSPETQRDGEVVENRITYKVRQFMIPKDGETLHAALLAVHFGTSPRLGSKPTIWSGGAAMSLFKSTSQRSYSLVFNVDTRKQQIVVESYQLGSKYDRLM